MPAAVWCTGLLLSLLSACASLETDCVLGIIGHPVSLPCFHPAPSTSVNFTLEWRRGDDVVLRWEWGKDGHSTGNASIPADAPQTGNLSLELPTVHPTEDKMNYSLLMVSGANQSAPLCTVCLRAAASFSSPLLRREDGDEGDETAFMCHSTGGFPEPAVYWLINDTEEPPEGSVSTLAASLPDSHLYNVTSHLMVNISKDASVSCTIENASMNQTLTSTSHGVRGAPAIKRASEAMWIFSTALCVVVGVLVIAGVAYQIHLDRISKRKKKEYHSQHVNRGYKRRHLYELETEAMRPNSIETDV